MLSLGAGLLSATPASAVTGTGPADNQWPAATSKPAATAEEKAVDAARAEAKSTGKPVLLNYLTTANSQTFVTPRGTLTTESSPLPERVKAQDGTWRPADATLRANADGSVSPVASVSAVTLSGGGTGPMATMTTPDGKKLAVKAPFPLPKPAINGNDALYANVLPDIDLRLSANTLGGWSQVLIVRTAEAAANPALAKIHLAVDAPDLNVAADGAGNISAKDAQGKARFSSPTSLMWDSTTATAPFSESATSGKSAAAALLAAPSADRAPESSADGPGSAATVAEIDTTVDPKGIQLVPDASLLTHGVGPWYLDPGINPTLDNGTQAWSQVQEAYPDTNEFNGTADGQNTPAAGYCGYSSTCTRFGRERAYFQLGINSALYDAEVIDARLNATVVSSSSPSTPTPMGLYHTGGISNPTKWTNQPCAASSRMGGCSRIGSATISGTGDIQYDVTAQMKSAAKEHWSTFTFGFTPDDENKKEYRQRFSNSPHVVVEYAVRPTVWWPRTRPTPGFADSGAYADCRTPGAANPWDNPGWISANNNITLTTQTYSATKRQLQTTFQLWDDDNNGATTWHQTGWNGDYGDATVDVGPLIDGHQYGWTARDTDGTLTSTETEWCYFRVDRTPPTAAVTSTDFPASGTVGALPKHVNEEGTFTLTGTDRAPAGGGRTSGLACARWTTDPVKAADTSWKCTGSAADPRIIKLTGGTATIKVTPPRWGTNFVYLQTQDVAGNMSQPVAYSYYAPSKANNTPVFGDITGDSKADVLLADGGGNLRQIGGDADPAGAVTARPNLATGWSTWSGVQTTHRGSLSYKNVDDLIAHRPTDPNLYIFPNDATARFDGQAPIAIGKPTTCQSATGATIPCATNGYGTDWSKTTQIAAFGSPAGESAQDGALAKTSLLFVENGRLWLAKAALTANKLAASAILLSANDTRWDGYELLTPGRAQGTDLPTLWARSKTDGTLHAFSVKGTPEALDLTGFTNPAAGTISGTYDPARYPRVGSDGDLTGDGIPDLWAVDTTQQLFAFKGLGTAPNGTTGPTVTGVDSTPVFMGNVTLPAAQWKLAEQTGSTTAPSADGATKYPATASGITWPVDSIGGRQTPYAAFNGPQSTITTAVPVVDTRKSFTLSTWAKPGDKTGIIASQDTSRSSSFILYADAKDSSWHFALANADTDGWPFDFTATGNDSARFTPNTWTRLTAVYNADSGQMSLYVNGVLAGSGQHAASTSPTPSGPLVFGRFKVYGAPWDSLTGGVSNFAYYPYAATPTAPAVTARISMTAAPATCIDNDQALAQDGNKIQVTNCNDTLAQKFEVKGDGAIRVQGMCLEAANAGTANTTLIQLMTCHGTPAQKFIHRADGSIYNPVSGRCVDLGNFNTSPGTPLWLFDCNRSDAQRWTNTSLNAAPLPVPAP
ncbi:concanavalin A-like lectin/glucanase superfamily protein [Streptomyces sp. 2132.2]|uniref:ricin-type beta-trefoil lectin domain protein n=1 Tax=Streptomyces sp. 2132.2 TaxID=2485161 RepID=UPI000F49264B|nr:ricin-type beta-trefoil lectin domain protein [Streptomyces sp. 2132.2]ROQ93641.1 concanavalin A-like lectin/glucanase superfamily protein [Streptomyces sp. 2132.2]